MRRVMMILVLVSTVSLATAQDWEARATFRQGLLFADAWDPGFSGASVGMMAWKALPFGHLGAGLEFGLNDIAWQATLPISYRLEYAHLKRISLGFELGLSNGVALFRPYPLWSWSVSVHHSIVAAIGQGWGLGLSVGMVYSASPQYASISTAAYSALDAPVNIFVRRSFPRARNPHSK